jgi:hypothetical protein
VLVLARALRSARSPQPERSCPGASARAGCRATRSMSSRSPVRARGKFSSGSRSPAEQRYRCIAMDELTVVIDLEADVIVITLF